MKILIRSVFGLYRWVVSPFFHLLAGPGAGCRFPRRTCSAFSERAILRKGVVSGGWLSMRRFSRCQPFFRAAGAAAFVLLSAPTFAVAAEVQTANGVATLGDGMALLQDWKLSDYRSKETNYEQEVVLNSVTNWPGGSLFFFFNLPELKYLTELKRDWKRDGENWVWAYEDENVKLVRTVSATTVQPYVDFQITGLLKNLKPNFAFICLYAQGLGDDEEERDRQFVYWTNQSKESIAIVEEREEKETFFKSPFAWMGTTSRYFTLLALPQGDFLPTGLMRQIGDGTRVLEGGEFSFSYPLQGDQFTIPLRVYFGPKDLATLRAIEPTLDHVVDLGFFTFLAYPMLNLLKWFYSFFQNYGIAIILLTLLVKIITYPLTYKSMKSMRRMAEMQPEIQKLQKKYKDDRVALNREMMTFMKSRGYNPMAGCWPILIQMPIFFALYQVLYSAVELYQAPFAFWLTDLSAKDPYYVMPVLVSLTWFLQQKLTPQTVTDPTQKRIMQMMPLIFGLFMITLPSGLGVYFLANAVLSIVQQLMLNKKLGPPPNMAPAQA